MTAEKPLHVLVTIGTRPEAVKLAPVVFALRAQPWATVRVLLTAQHRELLDQTLAFFGVTADVDLDLMRPGQSLADLTGRMIPAVDEVLGREAPDLVLAQGDTTTVMVTALACFYRKVAFGHVEAGLRTRRKYEPFPEEINRALVARIADLHFAPTETARDNLRAEGIADEAIVVCGNTVIDALLWTASRVDPKPFQPAGDRRLVLVTSHRRENFGAPLEQMCRALVDLVEARDIEILYPVHPNPNVRAAVDRFLRGHPRIRLIEPLGYAEFVAAMKAAYLILTDSGGVQEEAPSLGKPVLVLREQTERPEGVAAGTARLVGCDRERIVRESLALLDDPEQYRAMAHRRNPYGDGRAAEGICAAIANWRRGQPIGAAR
ncbi:MAG TPA: UDP-N-acetylglucosamine 2-epimerase (non-hydrolyzing) [Planctomycetota bacterium]|nr:UDP-N-acetylglucosamine 2-epimerase (non-hydrolyzing) [Planctomycetota bacterium]